MRARRIAAPTAVLVAFIAALVAGAGCAPPSVESPSAGAAAGAAADAAQTAFRVRSDIGAPLNADAGWAAGLSEDATVFADQPFRLRFEVEAASALPTGTAFRLQYRRNAGAWTDAEAYDFPYPERATPRVSVVSTSAYEPGAATDDLLAASTAPFSGGAGVNLEAVTAGWSGAGQSEWEWPLVVRRYTDGAVTNDAGDAFAFRLVHADGTPLDAEALPVLTLAVPAGHLGGTFVETPGRIGPWQASNGDLYFIMEPTETDNVLMMVKSSDGGATWQEVDGANRPVADDLEGVGSDLFGDTVHILHQTSEHVWHHAFRTSDHPTAPDSWAARDESVATPTKPPTQVAALVARSDGSLVAAYGGAETIHVATRTTDGEWGEPLAVDADAAAVLSGPQMALGADDAVHLAYTDSEGTAWYRRFLPDGTLTPRERVAAGLGTTEYDVGSIAPLVYAPETDTVVVLYRLADGHLWERRATAGGGLTAPVRVTDRPVVQNAVDSDQVGADAIAANGAVHVVFIEDGTGHLYHTSSGTGGEWEPSALLSDDVRAQWIRGQRLQRPTGEQVYGYVLDAGSNGGSGRNTFGEVALSDE